MLMPVVMVFCWKTEAVFILGICVDFTTIWTSVLVQANMERPFTYLTCTVVTVLMLANMNIEFDAHK